MGRQSSARRAGDQYQDLYSWYRILDILDEKEDAHQVWLEHPKAGSVDDVVVEFNKPDSINSYYQIKYHVDHSKQYSIESLIEPVKASSKSLLQNLYGSWQKLSQSNPKGIEVWLVSNWGFDPTLGYWIRSKRRGFSSKFFEPKPVGKVRAINSIRQKWSTHLGIDETQLLKFCHSLYFELSREFDDLFQLVRAKMVRLGLDSRDTAIYTALGLIEKWIGDSGDRDVTAISQSMLMASLNQHGLHAQLQHASFQVSNTQKWHQYLEHLQKANRNWYLPQKLQKLVDWELEPVPLDSYFALSFQKYSESKTFTLEDSLDQTQNLVICGQSGSGKSSCIRFLAFSLANASLHQLQTTPLSEKLRIPILINLREYGHGGLQRLVEAQFAQFVPELRTIVKNQIDGVEFWFLLDATDEASEKWRTDLANDISVFIREYSSHRFIITSRPPILVQEIPIRFVQPLKDAAQEDFALAYLESERHKWDSIQDGFWEFFNGSDLTTTPLLLALGLIVFRKNSSTIHSIGILFDSILDLYRREWEKPLQNQRAANPIEWDVLLMALQNLSWEMVKRRDSHFLSREIVLRLLQATIADAQAKILWRQQNNAFDLLNQLAAQGFLDVTDSGV
ncbi:MAG: NACHT domain-containing protein, partial [Candidatus Promineifilaceae bacterium]